MHSTQHVLSTCTWAVCWQKKARQARKPSGCSFQQNHHSNRSDSLSDPDSSSWAPPLQHNLKHPVPLSQGVAEVKRDNSFTDEGSETPTSTYVQQSTTRWSQVKLFIIRTLSKSSVSSENNINDSYLEDSLEREYLCPNYTCLEAVREL